MMHIKLLGPTTVEGPGIRRQANELGGVKPRQLLQMLALEVGTPVPKDRLAEWLWEGQPPPKALATLESYVSLLRRRLAVPSGRGAALATTNSGYMLDAEQVSVDVVRARELFRQGGPSRVEQALGLVTGELLVDEPYAAWANEERERFAALLETSCTAAAAEATGAGDPARAVTLARSAVTSSRLSEQAWQQLMWALWRSGRRAEALQAYAELRAVVQAELGVEPSGRTHDLYLRILRSDSRQAGAGALQELRTLLRLLAQAIEAGVDLADPRDQRLLEVGRMLLAEAG